MLLTIGGNTSPSASDITDLLGSVECVAVFRAQPILEERQNLTSALPSYSVSADSASVEKVISELSGKDINELIATGANKLASVPSGGGGGGGSAPAAATSSAPAAAEEKKEEKAEEKEGSSRFEVTHESRELTKTFDFK